MCIYTVTMSQKSLANRIHETNKMYRSIGRVWCPVIHDYVYFTSEGRVHLFYKGNRKKRSVAEQHYKLRFFPLVIPVLKHSASIQDWRQHAQGKQGKSVQYYALSCVVGRRNPTDVRVIIKRTSGGQFNYHSVMENKPKRSTKKPRVKRG